jgi:hypothetical protein
MIEALLDPGADRRAVLRGWGGFIIAAWAVALLNPEGPEALIFPVQLLRMQSLGWIGEWAPINFSHLQPAEIIILAALAVGFSGKVTLPPIRLVMFLGLVHGALSHTRNQQLLGLVGALVLAEPIGVCLTAANLARGRAVPIGSVWRRLSIAAALIAAIALVVRVTLPLSPERSGAAFAAALEAVPKTLRARPVLNDYSLGGALIFNGIRPFIDSRADLYGDDFLARYHRLVFLDRAELARTLSEDHIVWTIFRADNALVPVLDAMPGWHRLSDTNGIIIHIRDSERLQGPVETPR